MTDIITEQQLSADFKGVPFSVRSEEIPNVGRRIIIHEYLNSDQRTPEDIGLIPDRFTVPAFVHGINFLAESDALRAALNSEGPGILNLPTFGRVEAFALPYTVRTSQTAVGEIEFELSFVLGQPQLGPARSEKQLEDLFRETDDARGNVQLVLSLLWDKPETTLGLLASRYDVVQSMLRIENDYRPLLTDPTSDAWLNLITGTALSAPLLITSGLLLANGLIQNTKAQPGAWQSTSESIQQGAALGIALEGTNFGEDLSIQIDNLLDPFESEDVMTDAPNFWPTDTVERNLRNEDRALLISVFRINSLLLAYEQAAAQDYETESEIVDTRALLHDAYERVIRSAVTPLEEDSRVVTTVNTARFTALEILERKSQFTPRITALTLVSVHSALSLAYTLYAEEFTEVEQLVDKSVELSALNPDISISRFVGDVSIFDTRV